jgi:hypothetical protein
MQFRNNCDPFINHEEWTEEEKMKLQEVVRLYQEHDWCSIADAVGNHRTPLQCLQTYQVMATSTSLLHPSPRTDHSLFPISLRSD